VDLTTQGISYESIEDNVTITINTTHGFSSLSSGNHPVRIVYYVRISQINIEDGGGGGGGNQTTLPTVKDIKIKFFLEPSKQVLTIIRSDGLIITLNQTIVDGSTIEIEPNTYTFCFWAIGYKEKCFTDTITEDEVKRITLSLESSLGEGEVTTVSGETTSVDSKKYFGLKFILGIIILITIIIYLIYPKEETEWVEFPFIVWLQ
jgi:hypothetical protein